MCKNSKTGRNGGELHPMLQLAWQAQAGHVKRDTKKKKGKKQLSPNPWHELEKEKNSVTVI